MESKPALVILAAGLGSRYGSLKQIDKFGPSGETIVDYAIYDAIRAGFRKIVFVIKKEIEEEFKEIFLGKLSPSAQVEYVFQELDKLPEGYIVPKDREKPWGTAHAVMMAASKLDGPFAIVNADDFYGRQSLKMMYDQLCTLDQKSLSACMVGFILKNTLSDFGRVSRGICEVDDQGMLSEIVERTHIFKGEDHPYYVENEEQTALTGEEIVSMNLMGFTHHVFPLMLEEFKKFLNRNKQTGDLKEEYFIPYILDRIRRTGVKIPVINTNDKWFGVTYKADKSIAKEKLNELVAEGHYPEKLWETQLQ